MSDQLVAELESVLRSGLKELWDGEEDAAFLREVAAEMAEQYRLFGIASTDEEKALRKSNLEAWKSILQLKAAQRALRLKPAAEGLLKSILGVIVDAAKVYVAGKLEK